jgi:S-disulfanyl-L-cysteine oxidoreductase SoxD
MFKLVSAHIAGCQGTLAALLAGRLRRCATARVRLVHVAVTRLASISSRAALCTLTGLAIANAASAASNLGRPATPAEIRAWDIDVRPDFKGLPTGSGSVSKGQDVWEAKCESCHGAFGESNEFFTPIVGHTKPADLQTGRVAALRGETVPQRTTLMKLSQLSTLWDYINRAMPWNAPKSLTTDEVYAVTAYILHLGNIVPADFVLSDKNIAATQGKLPNRNGKTLAHAMWNVKDKPDVQGSNCTANCVAEVKITSRLPDYARNAHGNLAEQNRIIGAIRGVDTRACASNEKDPCGSGSTAISGATANRGGTAPTAQTATLVTPEAFTLAQKHACTACHGVNNKILGPSFADISKKYGTASAATLAAKIKAGGSGVWGSVLMPAQAHVSDADIRAMAEWLAAGKF